MLWKSWTAAHKQGWGDSQWQGNSLNRDLRNWNGIFPKKNENIGLISVAKLLEKYLKCFRQTEWCEYDEKLSLCLNWKNTCRIRSHYSVYHCFCDEMDAPLPVYCAICRIVEFGCTIRTHVHACSCAPPLTFLKNRANRQGRRHEFSNGGTNPDWGRRIQVSRNHPPPNSDFFSGFAHFILEILENLKVSANIPKIFCKKRDFWGNIPQNFETGDTSPASPRWRRRC